MAEDYTERVQKCRTCADILWAALPNDADTLEAAELLREQFYERLFGIALAPFGAAWRQDTFFSAWEEYVDGLQDLAEQCEEAEPSVIMP